jgi:SWI/SNF-related matrix-associated actin-dependent regulator of chromatin subfamily A-like protein 1
MTYAGHDNDFIFVKGDKNIALSLGAEYQPRTGFFRIPKNKSTLTVLARFLPHPTISKLLAEEAERVEIIKFTKSREDAPTDDERLRPYQAVDISIIKDNAVLAIFNEQRTGKTPTILKALNGIKKGLIVCPSSLKLNWLKEMAMWHDNKGIVITGSKPKRLKTYAAITDETIIISYETLRADINDILKTFKTFNYLIVDEAHRLRNYKTLQSKALFKVRKISKRVYPMTGTPAVNHPVDVYGILRLMYPTRFNSYWQFTERYFTVIDGYFGKDIGSIRKDRADEFNELLFTHSLQRKRREVMKWVPKVSKRTIELEPSSKQNTMFNEIIKKNSIMGEDIPNAITKLTRLRQVCVDPNYFGVDAPTPKIEFIMQYLEDNDESVIIFSTMTQTLKRLHKAIPGSMLLTGEQSTQEKQFAVSEIQGGGSRVLLANIRAGGMGFTIDKADTIIFLDKSYTPDENDQASDRFIPVNPQATYGAKQIITLVVNGSVEPKIETMLEQKINIIKYVNDYGIDAFLR